MNIVYLPFTFQDEEFETTDDSMTEEKINDKENSFMSMSMDEKKNSTRTTSDEENIDGQSRSE